MSRVDIGVRRPSDSLGMDAEAEREFVSLGELKFVSVFWENDLSRLRGSKFEPIILCAVEYPVRTGENWNENEVSE